MHSWMDSAMYEPPDLSSHGDPRSIKYSPTISVHSSPPKVPPTAVTTWSNVPDEVDTSQEVGIRPERKRLKKGKNRIAGLRREIMGNRLRLREKRRELRDEQSIAIDLETKLMQSIQQLWERGVVPDKITFDNVYTSLKETRDRLGPMEDNYDWEEDEHNALEFQLDEEDAQCANSDTGSEYQSTMPGTSEFEVAVPEPLNPILNEYYSRVGDANIIHERLEDLRMEHTNMLDDAEFRKNHNVKLYVENVEFLAGVHNRYDELYAELEKAEADIAKLGLRATKMGLKFDQRTPIRIVQQPLPNKRANSKDKAPVLHRVTQDDSVLPYLLSDYIELRARISCWILNNLRYSPIERVKYDNILSKELERDSIDDEAWVREVFEYWRVDDKLESFDALWDDLEQPDGFQPLNIHRVNGEKKNLQFPLGTRKAWKAVLDHDVFFGEEVKDFSAYREKCIRATLDRGYGYPLNCIEDNLLPVYESRSI